MARGGSASAVQYLFQPLMSLQGASRTHTLDRDAPCLAGFAKWRERELKFSPLALRKEIGMCACQNWLFGIFTARVVSLFFREPFTPPRVKGVSGFPFRHRPPFYRAFLYTFSARRSLRTTLVDFSAFFFARYLNAERNEAVKMFRHAQFIMSCEWQTRAQARLKVQRKETRLNNVPRCRENARSPGPVCSPRK